MKITADTTKEEYEDYLDKVALEGYEDGLNNQEMAECPYPEDTYEYDFYMNGVDAGIQEWMMAKDEWDEEEEEDEWDEEDE